MRLKKSQSIIDFVLVFMAVAALTVGIVRIWVWFNVNYASRQQAYQTSRLIAAGRPRPYDANSDTAPWPQKDKPVDIGATKKCPDCEYKPLDLTEEWIFQGKPSGTVTSAPGGTPGSIPSIGECADNCKQKCRKDPSCFDEKKNFNGSCPCYTECYAPCVCKNQISSLGEAYTDQIKGFCGTDLDCQPCSRDKCISQECVKDCGTCTGQACQFRRNAYTMDKAADKCDDPWEFCWWGNWGRLSRELREAAVKLRKSAYTMEKIGSRMQETKNELEKCCQETSAAEQKECFERAQKISDCDKTCFRLWQAVLDKCYYRGADEAGCVAHADEQYGQCMSGCKRDDSAFCHWVAQSIIEGIMERIKRAEEEKTGLQAAADDIQKEIDDCNSYASGQARYSCWNRPTNGCYKYYYELYRNKCCYQYSGSDNKYNKKQKPWKRYCDSPMQNCDKKGKGCDPKNPDVNAVCPKCSLAKLILDYQERIREIDANIAQLKEIIPRVNKCCRADCSKLPKPKDKAECRQRQDKCFECAQTDCTVFATPGEEQRCLDDQEKCLQRGGSI